WYKVEAYRNVLVAKIAVAAGAPFSAESFSIESRDVAASSAPVPVDGAPRGARLKHAVQAGQILLQNDLEPIPAVTRNQEVSVRIQAGMIAIEAPGVALSDGLLGATVRVQNPSSKEIYQAKVVDDGIVAVNLK